MPNLSKTLGLLGFLYSIISKQPKSLIHKQSGKLTMPLLVLLAICLFCRVAEAKYGGGSGTEADPYLIYTAEQMNAIGTAPNDWDKHFKLMADIDLSGFTGTDFNIIGTLGGNTFTGLFDGNGCTISNLTYTSTDTDYVGLFAYVDGAQIKDLGLIAPDVDAGTGNYIGSLVGYLREGTITNCYVAGGNVSGAGSSDSGGVGGLVGGNGYYDEWLGGAIAGTIFKCYSTGSASGNKNVGGLVGENFGTISTCYSKGGVSGDSSVGGLVGSNGGTITNSYATSSVSGQGTIGGLVGNNGSWGEDVCRSGGSISNSYATGGVSGNDDIGGLVGWNGCGIISNCYSTATVWGDKWVGGLVGSNSDTIIGCYSIGSVIGTEHVGGLVGSNDETIIGCYSVGAVRGTTDVGGLLGLNGDFSKVYDSFWDVEASGQYNMCGKQEKWASGCNDANGKTTAEMQDPNTFMDAGWDFVGQSDGPHDIWSEPVGGGYPILWWQLSRLPELPSFSGGTGELDNPYLLSTANELNSIGHNPRLMGGHFKLINNIDLTGVDFFIIGNRVFAFTGVFDGNGHTISNFSYTSTDTGYIGLFGFVRGENAQIKDLGLIGPNIEAGTGGRVGSLVGELWDGTITNCYAEGGSVSGDLGVGGLVGFNYGTITNCYATSSISGNDYVGGLVGRSGGTIANCYSTGSVAGNEEVGGLVGRNSGTISNCYSVGSVSGRWDVGGLVGYNFGTVTASFWDIQTSGQTTSARGWGKTTAEMQTESAFTSDGWDFLAESANGTEDIWSICEGADYPKLTWQFVIGDFDGDSRVGLADFAIFAGRWLRTDRSFFCRGDSTDLTNDGNVDFNDLKELADNWLAGVE